jgi:methionyl-tRNA formyltransferase
MSQNKWNIIFMGTPQFALPALKQLHLKENIIAVYTQPDRPSGRGQKVTAPPIKELAIKLEIPCYQPPQLKNGDLEIKRIEDLKPDLIVVVAYGLFFPP